MSGEHQRTPASDAEVLYSKICELRGIQDTTPRERMPAILEAITEALNAARRPALPAGAAMEVQKLLKELREVAAITTGPPTFAWFSLNTADAENRLWAALTMAEERGRQVVAPVVEAAEALYDAHCRTNRDRRAPARFGMNYGELNALRQAIDAYRALMPAAPKEI